MTLTPAVVIRPSMGPAEHPALLAIWRSAVDATLDALAEPDRDEIAMRSQITA